MKLTEIIKSLKEKYDDFKKKRYIRNEIYNLYCHKLTFDYINPTIFTKRSKDISDGRRTPTKRNYRLNKIESEYVDRISNSIFKGSKMVHAEIMHFKQVKEERENTVVVNSIRTVIDKHYKDVENKRKSIYERKEYELHRKVGDLEYKLKKMESEKDAYAKKDK